MVLQPIDDPDSIFTESNRHNLYLTATISDELDQLCASRASPRVILDTYVGLPEDLSAPEWTRWKRRTLEFRQPRESFIALFSQMALWQENLNLVGSQYLRQLTQTNELSARVARSYD